MTQLTTRELALAWWRGLFHYQQLELVQKHFPNKEFITISSSSSRIEEMYIKENDGK